MDYQDYYQTLGVSKTASDDEIKHAYRKLAKQYHPDQNRGNKAAEEKFKAINEAYEVLKDKEKRARYDQLGASYKQWEQGGGSGSNFNWSDWFTGNPGGYAYNGADFGNMGGFSDFFSQIFGGMGGGASYGGSARKARTAPRGRTAPERVISISLREAFEGTRRVIMVNDKKLEASIPAGAKTGTKVRLSNAVQYAGGSEDLILVINAAEKEGDIERQGDDLIVDVSVSVSTAALGGEVRLRTFEGTFALKIPAGTQPGQKFRMGGKGMPKLDPKGTRGDLYARVRLIIPKALSPIQRKLFEELRENE